MAPRKINHISDLDGFVKAFPVSRETADRLQVYERLLTQWQKTINLVAPSTLDDVWHRHFADSAQIWSVGAGLERSPTPRPDPLPMKARGEGQRWLDLGSGAGFPGLVLAILGAESGLTRHTIVESDNRKAAFLREVARNTGVAVDILCARIENPSTAAKVGESNVVTARALAPLPRLLELSFPYFGDDTTGVFLKGREAVAEVELARKDWDFSVDLEPSLTGADASVVVIKSLKVRA